ncbi:MAG: hypothetical protein GXX95_03945 [Methanomassiliicoccus sp.]|nr:hypothetical protein [Methanomassiliicoccus sp.]
MKVNTTPAIKTKKGQVVIVFGAGASYGVSSCTPRNPPLSTTLFLEMTKDFPVTWGVLPPYLKDVFNDTVPGSFERGMGLMLTEARESDKWNLKTYQKDLGQYFAGFRLGIGDDYSDPYTWFVKEFRSLLESGIITIGSLNYDCLLDEAIQKQGLKIAYKPGANGVKLDKIHGSCNFLPSIKLASLEHYANKIIVPFEVESLDGLVDKIKNSQIQPAMRFFTKDKDNLTCSAELDAILFEFQSLVNDANLVIIIGVKPNPDDKHIWDHIMNTKAKVVLISPDDKCGEWLTNYRSGKYNRWYPMKFEECHTTLITEIEDEIKDRTNS